VFDDLSCDSDEDSEGEDSEVDGGGELSGLEDSSTHSLQRSSPNKHRSLSEEDKGPAAKKARKQRRGELSERMHK